MSTPQLRQSLQLLSISLRSIDDRDHQTRLRCRAAAWLHLAEALEQADDVPAAVEARELAADLAREWKSDALLTPAHQAEPQEPGSPGTHATH